MSLLKKSKLIQRKQLAVLSGATVERTLYPKNPLKLGTPISHVGGRCIATKDGLVHHICIKEQNNRPLPPTTTENLQIYRYYKEKQVDGIPMDITLLQKHDPRQKSVPVFWEPANQPKKGTRVVYIGHWKPRDIKTKTFEYLGIQRCAIVYLSFDRYDECFGRIIKHACELQCKAIGALDFDQAGNVINQQQQEVPDALRNKEIAHYPRQQRTVRRNTSYFPPWQLADTHDDNNSDAKKPAAAATTTTAAKKIGSDGKKVITSLQKNHDEIEVIDVDAIDEETYADKKPPAVVNCGNCSSERSGHDGHVKEPGDNQKSIAQRPTRRPVKAEQQHHKSETHVASRSQKQQQQQQQQVQEPRNTRAASRKRPRDSFRSLRRVARKPTPEPNGSISSISIDGVPPTLSHANNAPEHINSSTHIIHHRHQHQQQQQQVQQQQVPEAQEVEVKPTVPPSVPIIFSFLIRGSGNDSDSDEGIPFVQINTPLARVSFHDIRRAIQEQLEWTEAFQFRSGPHSFSSKQEQMFKVQDWIGKDDETDGSIQKPYRVAIKMMSTTC